MTKEQFSKAEELNSLYTELKKQREYWIDSKRFRENPKLQLSNTYETALAKYINFEVLKQITIADLTSQMEKIKTEFDEL